jgi:hypothetical protein
MMTDNMLPMLYNPAHSQQALTDYYPQNKVANI